MKIKGFVSALGVLFIAQTAPAGTVSRRPTLIEKGLKNLDGHEYVTASRRGL
jgi:hypothetical protein